LTGPRAKAPTREAAGQPATAGVSGSRRSRPAAGGSGLLEAPGSEELTRAVEQLLSAKEVVVACGPGGVGKTTTAAAIALTAAVRLGGRVLVVTVDPARRLADALGIGGIGNVARRVPPEAIAATGVRASGELYAAMLDMGESWDALVRRHAPDPDTASAILSNPLYRNITRRFAQGQGYIAMERLHELHERGDYDLVVVDTPPSRNALDLLDAPGRMQELFSSRLLRWLVVPYRSRLVNVASRPFYQVADRVLGSQFLEDLASFFILFQTMRDGFVDRAEAVTRLLRDVRTTFVVVTTLEAVPAVEARQMIAGLRQRDFHLGLLVCNKVLPRALSDPENGRAAELLGSRGADVAARIGALTGAPSPEMSARVLAEVADSFGNFRLVAHREQELLRELSSSHELTSTVPYHPGHVTDLRGLLEVGATVFGDPVAPEAARRGRAARAVTPTGRATGASAPARPGKRVRPPQSDEA